MTNFLQPKLYFVVKSLSICPGILTKIIRIWRAPIYTVTEGTRNIPKFNVFCALEKKERNCLLYILWLTQCSWTWGIPHANFEEKGPNMLFQQDRTSGFSRYDSGEMSWTESLHRNGSAERQGLLATLFPWLHTTYLLLGYITDAVYNIPQLAEEIMVDR